MTLQEVVRKKIIVALDVATLNEAERLAAELALYVGAFKVGTLLVSTVGLPAIAQRLRPYGPLFLDWKLHAIPSEVEKCVELAVKLGIEMMSVHASAGEDAVRAAISVKGKSKIIGLTVLTSLTDGQCRAYIGNNAWAITSRLALLLCNQGVDGILSAPDVLEALRPLFSRMGIPQMPPIYTAGIRPPWASMDDHAYFTTPTQAIEWGADYLIIGRPIITPPSTIGTPVDAVQHILEEVAHAL